MLFRTRGSGSNSNFLLEKTMPFVLILKGSLLVLNGDDGYNISCNPILDALMRKNIISTSKVSGIENINSASTYRAAKKVK